METHRGVRLPDIYDYTDYRKYLTDLYNTRKEINRAFSYRLIAQKAGLASPSFIGKILSGAANISHQTLMRLCDVFQIIGPDAEYFELMVNFESARSEPDKNHYFQRMQALRRRYGKVRGEDAGNVLQSAWFVAPILSLIELGLFNGDHAALGRMLTPPISPRESRLAIELLMLHGFIQKDSSGRHSRVPGAGNTHPNPLPSPAIAPSLVDIPADLAALLDTLPENTPFELRERIRYAHRELTQLLRQAQGIVVR